MEAFVRMVAEGTAPPIPVEDLLSGAAAALAALESMRTGCEVKVAW